MNDLSVLVEQAAIELSELPQADCPVRHFFAPNLCVREVSMPAGVMAVGHWQKFDHLNVFLKGKVRMLLDDGSFVDMEAPMIFVGKAGRKVGYILEDIVWLNIYSTDLTDPEEVENYFLDKTRAEWFGDFRLRNMLPAPQDNDYLEAIAELGYTQDMVEKEYKREDDLMAFPFGSITVQVSNSPIHGKGLFATANMNEGDLIPARINGKRTPAGRYTNHAKNPNAEAIDVNGDIYWKLVKPVSGNKGGLLGNEITVDYRQAFKVSRGLTCQQQ